MSKKKKDWKTERERLLRLDQEERRKEYRRQDFISLDKIPSWREENTADDKDEGKEPTGGGGLSDKVSLYKGDITGLELDAIVNAANSSLLGGGGVDGCIHKAAGSCLYDECHSLNGCDTGKAKITCGYDLPAKYVIHTVGPVARGHVGPTETNDLTSCYQNSLRLMKEHGLRTVAFPCISTGIYGFPNEPAAEIALNTVKSWIEENPDKITQIIFCVFLETDFNIYKKKMSVMFQDNDMEVPAEQPKGDATPPPAKSATEEESEEGNRGTSAAAGIVEPGDEEEGDNAAAGKEDVEMASQNPDDAGKEDVEMASQNPDEDLGNEEENQEKTAEKIETQEKEVVDIHSSKAEDKGIEKEKGDKEEEQPAAKMEDGDTAKSTVDMEDGPEINDTGTSNGEGMKDPVESSEEPDSIPTDSNQSKDTVEKKE